MAALHFENGTWDVFVTEGLIRGVLNRTFVETDILGRKLPTFTQLQAVKLAKPSEAIRLANHLKGLSLQRRQQVYEEWSRGASQTWINK
ncbi:MAG: hypothetical protein V4659_08080 [Pseudomonadota bacterium]